MVPGDPHGDPWTATQTTGGGGVTVSSNSQDIEFVYISNSQVSETDRIGRQTISVSTPDDPLSDVPTTTSHQAGGR